MTLKRFLPKGGLVRYQLKQFWWVSALYALMLFFATPFVILSRDQQDLIREIHRFPQRVGQILYNNSAVFVFLIGAAIIIGVCVFRYMQATRSATLFHAFPVTRTRLYLSTLASGFVLLALPILVNAMILFCMSFWGGYGVIIPPLNILDWIAGQLLTGTATMFFCIFVGVLTGSSVGQFLFTFALCGIPVGLMALSGYLLDNWLFGFTADGLEHVLEFLLKITPIYYPQFFASEGSILWIPALEGAYIILFAALGLWLYHKRDTERAGDVAAFPWIRPIFLYTVTLCVMLAGTCFVAEIMTAGKINGSPNVFILLFFALLGYAVAKMLLTKSFRILPYYKGYVAFAAIVLIGFFAIDMNLFGFGTTVPKMEQIEQVYVGNHYYHGWPESLAQSHEGIAVFHEAESIEAARKLHNDAINANVTPYAPNENQQKVYISYQLKSGRCITRAYRFDREPIYALYSTDAAKDSMYPNFRLHPENIRYIVLPNTGDEIYGEKKEELIACVQKDLDRLSYEEITGHNIYIEEAAGMAVESEPAVKAVRLQVHALEVHIAGDESMHDKITLNYANKDYSLWFQLNSNFTETINWLLQNGYDIERE
ncbi:MAG: ABC transporter permease [Clostridia bacterium]|nr:ABC transporter permease [Clostridia bacterium]